MPINAGYEYLNAEKEYLDAQNVQDKIYWLEEMIRTAPKHKSAEKFLSELKTRLRKLKEKAEKASKKSGGRKGIKKEGFQFVLVGKTNSGKSALLAALTNAQPLVADYEFSTRAPEIGTFYFEGARAQVVDLPSVGSENFDVGIANTADCILEVVRDLAEVEDLEKILFRARGRRIVVVTKSDLLSENERRKFLDRIKSKKVFGKLVSSVSGDGLRELKEKMFSIMGVIRIYLKEPGKTVKPEPMVLKENSTVRDAANGIRNGFAATVRETRITGPSSKFPNQKVGLEHKLKDRDVAEFHTR